MRKQLIYIYLITACSNQAMDVNFLLQISFHQETQLVEYRDEGVNIQSVGQQPNTHHAPRNRVPLSDTDKIIKYFLTKTSAKAKL